MSLSSSSPLKHHMSCLAGLVAKTGGGREENGVLPASELSWAALALGQREGRELPPCFPAPGGPRLEGKCLVAQASLASVVVRIGRERACACVCSYMHMGLGAGAQSHPRARWSLQPPPPGHRASVPKWGHRPRQHHQHGTLGAHGLFLLFRVHHHHHW